MESQRNSQDRHTRSDVSCHTHTHTHTHTHSSDSFRCWSQSEQYNVWLQDKKTKRSITTIIINTKVSISDNVLLIGLFITVSSQHVSTKITSILQLTYVYPFFSLHDTTTQPQSHLTPTRPPLLTSLTTTRMSKTSGKDPTRRRSQFSTIRSRSGQRSEGFTKRTRSYIRAY